MRESNIERYLVNRVAIAGGTTRKAKWIGRAHCPDRYVMLPWITAWIETKRPKKEARAGQAREHARMRSYGVVVEVLNTKQAVDKWIEKTKRLYDSRPV